MESETVDGLTSIAFERGEFRLVIHHVPARICPNCGEAYVDEDVAQHLLRDAEDVLEQGIIEDVVEYSQ